MKTWRERVVDARGRGRFDLDDVNAWAAAHTCPVGEGVSRLGVEDYTAPWLAHIHLVNGVDLGTYSGASGRFLHAMNEGDFDTAEAILDEIEDRVLKIKREATS